MSSCSIIIPIYRPLSPAEFDLVRHNLRMLRGFPAVLIGGHGQFALLSELRDALGAADDAEITVETFEDRCFRDVSGYNSLLSEPDFYERFVSSDYILICQHDAIILKPTLREWLGKGYAFVGSPMFEGYGEPRRPLQFLQTLNGGLSLRHIPSTLSVFRNAVFLPRSLGIRVAGKVGIISAVNWALSLIGTQRVVVRRKVLNEDVLWTRDIAAAFPMYRIPSPEIAASFAFEVCPADLFARTGRQLPFGCHAFERYDPDFWLAHAPSEVVRLVRALTPANADKD
ncbi:DUF5672 family protein [Sedimentitalea todarodis]|uniref:DUF5672 family protein n=1 Tax=Sedimentitalea todarodis TaxID=1631240 RepID=A0ABU3V9I7_9RHOB|nr:DUF5672 family protein [Sedimentitalea todarodis]MDU9002824.1 DUF5672 family protein [Sedimentitalea todarodis]